MARKGSLYLAESERGPVLIIPAEGGNKIVPFAVRIEANVSICTTHLGAAVAFHDGIEICEVQLLTRDLDAEGFELPESPQDICSAVMKSLRFREFVQEQLCRDFGRLDRVESEGLGLKWVPVLGAEVKGLEPGNT